MCERSLFREKSDTSQNDCSFSVSSLLFMEDAGIDGVTAWTQTCIPKAAALPGNNEAERDFRPSLLQNTTRAKLVVGYRHFGTTCRSHLKGSNLDLGGRDRVVVPKRLQPTTKLTPGNIPDVRRFLYRSYY